jgi:ATP-dependent helicase/DNAse subunit B
LASNQRERWLQFSSRGSEWVEGPTLKDENRFMPSELTLLLGDAGTGKTERLLAEYRAVLSSARQQRRIGTALWIAPTQRAQQSIIARLLSQESAVQFLPNVLTFDVFAEQILSATAKRATRMSPVMKRLLLRRIVADLNQRGQLSNFASVTQTTGFLDVVSAFISELKREEIWPEEFVEACKHRPPKLAKRDKELGLIYTRYQRHLTLQNWYDAEGRFWLARAELEAGARAPFADVEFLVLDGFADFTQTQYEILKLLMGWIPRVALSIPCEDPTSRPELFDKPRSTISDIRKYLPSGATCRTERLEPDRSAWPAGLRKVAETLFASPRSVERSSDATGLELIASTGPLGECQAVASRIKTLLMSGTSADSIVVAVRAINDSGPVWSEYFEQAGIPVWCEAGTPLVSRPIVKSLFSVLQLELDDWPFIRLMQVLGSNYFQPGWPELNWGHGIRTVGAALRRLKLHSGREMIARVLSRVAAGITVDADPEVQASTGQSPGAVKVVAAMARNAGVILKRLAQVTDRLRQKRTLTEWSDVISSLGRDLGWEQLVQNPGDRDSIDWDLLQRILRTAGEADRKLLLSMELKSARQPKLDLAAFTAELRDLLGGETIKAPTDPGGCVRIVDVEQARHLDIPHLFMVGLSESSFPLNRPDDCLFGETERKEFARRGLPLQHRDLHQRDEMFLFHSIVTRAKSRLTLSYPSVNSKGQPLFASPYLIALKSLFDEDALETSHEGQLDPVPSFDRAMTESDLRLLSISAARTGNPGLFRRLCERPGWLRAGINVLAAIDVNTHRFHERGFTGYEGRLSTDTNVARLQQWFGTKHQFSPTELEEYATCPYRFWLTRVLDIEDLPTPEEGTDYAARGSLIHVVLAQMLREGMDKPEKELAQRFIALVDQHLSRRLHETDLQRTLTEIERRLLAEWGTAFAQQQTAYSTQLQEAWSGSMKPLPPEIPFGNAPGGSDSGIVTDPLTFGTGDSLAQVRGRIDRVDVGILEGGRVFNVIDYKTGNPPRSTIDELNAGRALQLAMYAIAIRRLGIAGDGANPYQLGYWNLKSTGFKRGYQTDKKNMQPMEQDLIDTLERSLEAVVSQLAMGIRSGKFLVDNSDPHCTSRCSYQTTCRVNQIRSMKTQLNKFADIISNRPEEPAAE